MQNHSDIQQSSWRGHNNGYNDIEKREIPQTELVM